MVAVLKSTNNRSVFIGSSVSHISLRCECHFVSNFCGCCFRLRQLGELLFAGAFRQLSAILVEKAEEQVDGSIGHVHDSFYAASKLIVMQEELGLPGQVLLDGLANTGVKELGVRGCVEEAVEVCRFVQDLDVAISGPPVDHRQQAPGVILEDGAIVIEPFENRRRDGEDNSRGIEASLRQNMVDEVTMDAAVAIDKGMDVDKPKSQGGGGDHGIESLRRSLIKGNHAVDQRRQIVRLGADMGGDGHARVPIMLADKATFFPESKLDEAGVADDDGLQPQEFFHIDGPSSRLGDGLPPAPDP